MPQPTCSVEECSKSVSARGLCSRHYYQWRKTTRPPCRVDGCEKPGTSADMCQMHYARRQKHGDPLIVKHRHDGNRVDQTQRKRCLQCGAEFGPTSRRSHAQWEKQQFCPGRSCASTWKARQQRPQASTQKRWAAAWERRRRIEDRADLKAWKPKVWPHCRLNQKPKVRTFLAGYCQACGESWVYYAKRAQSPYCATCAATRRSRPGTWRAKRAGAKTEPIIPRKVFERDQWRCQICKRKTRGQVPALLAPTLDHIVPLARGGSHTYDNLQCACYRCNCHVKRDGAANEQLLLIG